MDIYRCVTLFKSLSYTQQYDSDTYAKDWIWHWTKLRSMTNQNQTNQPTNYPRNQETIEKSTNQEINQPTFGKTNKTTNPKNNKPTNQKHK